MFAAFIAAMAVWFQSVMTSALEGDASTTTRHTLAAVTPLTMARGTILMVASWLACDCWLCRGYDQASSRSRIRERRAVECAGTPTLAHTAQKQPHRLGAARSALCAVCHITRVKVRTSAKSPCLALEGRVRRHNQLRIALGRRFDPPLREAAYARRRLVQSRNAVTNLRRRRSRSTCIASHFGARRLPRAEMRELQELPQPDRRGQADRRQIVLIHLIPRDQLAALQFRQRRSHHASGEALATMRRRRHDAADLPDLPMVLEGDADRARISIMFQGADESAP